MNKLEEHKKNVEASAAWHEMIASELKSPEIPKDCSVEIQREIEAQQARYETYARALKKLARIRT